MSGKRKFTWAKWDFDLNGEAYIIAKDECPKREAVSAYIANQDGVDCVGAIPLDEIQSGWCRFECRCDWDDRDGEPYGWYTVKLGDTPVKGHFPVWVVRVGDCY